MGKIANKITLSPETGHSEKMARTYGRGEMSNWVLADGNSDLMNLGMASTPDAKEPLAQRQEQLAGFVTGLLEPAPNELMVDLGCGRGGFLKRILNSVPSISVVGLNIDRVQLGIAGQHLHNHSKSTSLVSGDVQKLPFADNTFHRAVCLEMASHVPDKPALAAETHRVLKSGARFVMVVMTLSAPWKSHTTDEKKYLDEVAGFFHEDPRDFQTVDDYLACFSKAGFSLRSVEDLTLVVFGARYHEHKKLLELLRSTDTKQRKLTTDHLASQGVNDINSFMHFLEVNTRHDPLDYYAYTAMAWNAS